MKRKRSEESLENKEETSLNDLVGAKRIKITTKSGFVPDFKLTKNAKKYCQYPGCDKWPSYGYKGERSPGGSAPLKSRKFYVNHKLDGMIDVISKRCEHLGCNKRPSYGYEGELRSVKIAKF